MLPSAPALPRAAALFLAAGGAVFALQLLPLGSLLFPEAARLRREHGAVGWWPGTADPHLTLKAFCQVSAAALSGLLVSRLRRSGLSSGTALRGLLAVILVQAAWGVVQGLAGWRGTPFYDGPRGDGGGAAGTFVNRNTFAGFCAMGVPVAAALAYSRFAWGRTRRIESGAAWALAAALLLLAVGLSRSRGGAIGAAVGLLLLPLLQRGGMQSAAALAVGAAGALGMMLADPGVLLERFEAIDPFAPQEDSRWRIWTTTLAAWTRQPLLGFGAGTHRVAYNPWQPADFPGHVVHAHNEYVEALFEGGAVYLALLLAGAAAWLVRSLAGARRYAGPERFLPVAAVAAAGVEFAHAFVDMDLRVPSCGILFAALLAVGASLARAEASPSRRGGLAAALAAAAGAAALLSLPLRAERDVHESRGLPPAEAAGRLDRALGLSPFDAQAAFGRAEAARLRGELEDADRRYARAGDLWPANADLQAMVGLWHWERGDAERAARAYRRLFDQRPGDVEAVLERIASPGRPLPDYEALLPERPAAWGAYASALARAGRWKEALEAFLRRVPADPAAAAVHDRFADALSAAGQWGLEATVRERRLSAKSDPSAHAAAARAWLRLGALDRALDRAEQACRVDPGRWDWFALRAEVQRAKGEGEKALESLMRAASLAPLEPSLVRRRASLYAELKLHASAAEDWRALLRSHPGDREAAFGLAKALEASGDVAGARRVLDEYLGRAPADAEAKRRREALR